MADNCWVSGTVSENERCTRSPFYILNKICYLTDIKYSLVVLLFLQRERGTVELTDERFVVAVDFERFDVHGDDAAFAV